MDKLISSGSGPARKLNHARVLLKADADGPNWSDEKIREALDTSQSTIERVREAFVLYGLDAALNRKRPSKTLPKKLDGAQEAHLLAFALTACILIAALAMAIPNSFTLLWMCTIGLGFFMAPVWPTGYNLASQSVKLTATISSIILLGDSLGGMTLPALTGQVVERFGAQMMTWLVFASLIGNIIALWALLRLRGPAPAKAVATD